MKEDIDITKHILLLSLSIRASIYTVCMLWSIGIAIYGLFTENIALIIASLYMIVIFFTIVLVINSDMDEVSKK